MPPVLSGASYWTRRFGHWPRRSPAPLAGYTLLLPVPGDLPIFLDMALRVCAAQQAEHRVATIVLPDSPSAEIDRVVAAARPNWSGPLVTRLLPRPERWFLPRLHSGSRNHALQLVAGVSASRSTHIALHDADLFLLDHDLLDRQYLICKEQDLACIGLSPVWDDWFATKGLHLAATWDMVASVEWLRRWPPWRHMGHDDDFGGESHTFDTTLWAQSRTPPERIVVSDPPPSFVHFNYVISSYRHFQRQGAGYVDDRYRLLFIALLVELFSSRADAIALPDVRDLGVCLLQGSGAVTYPAATDSQNARYSSFRSQLAEALRAPYISDEALKKAAAALGPFDAHYRFNSHPAA
jgi:hypothetical protein